MAPNRPATAIEPRIPLSRDRILAEAVALADLNGLDALTMRNLGRELGVEAMSLYKHVANKDEILDGIIDIVIAEIEFDEPGDSWEAAMRRRAVSSRAVFRDHPWVVGLIDSRSDPGPAVLRYYEYGLRILRDEGFSIAAAVHGWSLVDSYIYGFALFEVNRPTDTADPLSVVRVWRDNLPEQDYPTLVEALEHFMRSDPAQNDQFEVGLDLILDNLETLLAGSRRDETGSKSV